MATTPSGMAGPFGFGSGANGPVVTAPNVSDDIQRSRTARALTIPWPEQFMIPSGTAFNPAGQIATAAVQAGIIIPNATIQIPVGNRAVIASVTFYITNMLASTDVRFTVLVNNNPVPGYQNIFIFPRVSPFVANSFDIPIRVMGEATVTVTFNNNDGGAYTVGAALSGWLWSLAAGQRWEASGL